MRDFPSCFGESGVQVADYSSSSSSSGRTCQSLVTCIYQCKLLGKSCFITINWTKNLMGQGFGVSIDEYSSNRSLCKVEIKPWLFSKRKGSKSLVIDNESNRIDIIWDFCAAKFGSGPEPTSGFYLAITFNQEIVLLVGDLKKEACKKIENECVRSNAKAMFVAKREHVSGKKLYGSMARFSDNGAIHHLTVECDTVEVKDPCLVIRIDNKTVMQIKRLNWKFRGNYTILVDGIPVQVFWDVHNWLFGNSMGNAVFMFKTVRSDSLSSSKNENVKDGEQASRGLEFSLTLYAWKND